MKDTSRRSKRPRRIRYRDWPDPDHFYGVTMNRRAYVLDNWKGWPGFIKGHFRTCLESIQAMPAPRLP